jgi:pimeloyl-ACP methyl ester carboxylesterase
MRCFVLTAFLPLENDHFCELLQIMPVELPGRNSRMTEPKQSSLTQLVDDLAEALTPLIREKPYALLGHSMGAWVVYELAKVLHSRGEPLPSRVYVAGNRAPHLHSAAHDPDQITPTLGTLPEELFWLVVLPCSRYLTYPQVRMRLMCLTTSCPSFEVSLL